MHRVLGTLEGDGQITFASGKSLAVSYVVTVMQEHMRDGTPGLKSATGALSAAAAAVGDALVSGTSSTLTLCDGRTMPVIVTGVSVSSDAPTAEIVVESTGRVPGF